MSSLDVHGHSLALLTDLYQLTMACGYWKSGRAELEAVFHLTYRSNPFGGGYAIAGGLATAAAWLESLRISADDTAYLAQLPGADGRPLFEPAFLDYLRRMEFQCDIDAIPEGTVVFPHEPLIRVRGPLLQCQLIETALLNIINFQTLIATKSSRICRAAHGDSVVEFGLRRAQGIDGGLSASRAAYIGGCHATSNVLAGKLFDIPVRGTHAHSWVMCFDDELAAFETYALAMPNNCVFLVDTYDTIAGVKRAVQVGEQLRDRGFEMIGIRLDSGDLADLSLRARQVLDAAGFPDAKIVASNDLDEFEIQRLKAAGAPIDVWGVGTRLATGDGQPALGGVYKLSAVHEDNEWRYKVKLSNDPIKVSNPGIQQVRRFRDAAGFRCDAIYDVELGIGLESPLYDPTTAATIPAPIHCEFDDLLVPIFRRGKRIDVSPSIHESRQRTLNQLELMPDSVTRIARTATENTNDTNGQYVVALEQRLYDLKEELKRRASGGTT